MNPALVAIVVHTIKERYPSERAFYQDKLHITAQSWDRWKKGEHGLKYENIQTLASLFTDYEWMLVQKVARNAEIVPEIMNEPVKEYLFLKYQIAQTWVRHGLARLEWHNADAFKAKANMTILHLIADYHFWGYNDIIELRLPGVIRQQIKTDEVKLLAFFDQEYSRLKGEQD